MTEVTSPPRRRSMRRWIWGTLIVAALIALAVPVVNHLSGMSTEHVLHRYGYWAIAVGTFLEGETVVAIGGFLASEKYLRVWWVMLVAFLGSYIGHIFWFWLGRSQGHAIIDRFPRLSKAFDRVIRLVDRHGVSSIFISQYIYGFRIPAAIMFGLSHIPLRSFMLWQALSCGTWAALMTGLGYFFGRAVQRILGQTEEIEKYGLIAIVVIAIAVFVYHKVRERRRKDA